MRTPTALRPRNAPSGATAILLLSACSAVITAFTAAVSNEHLGSAPLRWPAFGALMLAVPVAQLLRRHAGDPAHWCWAVVPFGWIGVYVLGEVGLRNPDMHAEFFLLFPAMFAARQLRRPPAVAIIVGCVALLPLLATTRPDTRDEMFVALYFGAALFAVTARLTATVRRSDGLLAEMRSRASTDPLTGLGTRRTLEMTVDRQGPCAPSGGEALLLIDVDNFKQINDDHGHPAGDAVLVQLAQIMRASCRPVDVPTRIGGDELAILYPAISRAAAQERADAIRLDVEQRLFALPDQTSIRVTVSLGVAHSGDEWSPFAHLYDAADRALYRAKRAGRNAVVLDEAA